MSAPHATTAHHAGSAPTGHLREPLLTSSVVRAAAASTRTEGRKRRSRSRKGRAAGRKISRQEALAKGQAVDKAAALIDLAEDGIGIPPSVLNSPDFNKASGRYFVFQGFGLLWSLVRVGLVALNFVEVPRWCRSGATYDCGTKEKYGLGDIPYLSPKAFSIVEALLLLLLALDVILPVSFKGPKAWWRTEKGRVAVLVLLVADAANADVGLWLGVPSLGGGFRLGPYARIVMVLLSAIHLRNTTSILIGIIPAFLGMLSLFALYIVFFSWVAFLLFDDTPQGDTYFTTFGATLAQMSDSVLTMVNLPYIWMPAIQTYRTPAIFFIFYLFVGCYFLMSLVLAVVYNGYKEQLVKRFQARTESMHAMLGAAFGMLDREKKGSLDVDQVAELLEALNRYRSVPPFSRADVEHIFVALDDSGDNRISLDEFQDLCTAIQLKFVKTDDPTFVEILFPGLYATQAFQRLAEFVTSDAFTSLFLGIIVLNAIAIIGESWLDIVDSPLQAVWLNVEMVFAALYVLELVLKVSAMGAANYWRVGSNQYDSVVSVFIFIAQVLVLTNILAEEWIRYVLIAVLLRLVRLLAAVPSYSVIFTTSFSVFPALAPLFGVILCIACLFVSAGMELFGGLVYDGAEIVASTGYGSLGYIPNNFNDFAGGMLLMFNLFTGTLQYFWIAIGISFYGPWIRIYFYLFQVVGVMFILNLFTGFVLEAFYVQEEIAKTGGQEGENLRLASDMHGDNVQVVQSAATVSLLTNMLMDQDARQRAMEAGQRAAEAGGNDNLDDIAEGV